MNRTSGGSRNHWLWVTRPEFYADEDGSDREDLDPGYQEDADGWWTCHRATRLGDLALLWRTAPRKDIGYLIEAMSDADSIADEDGAAQHGWDFGCEYRVVCKFTHPITIQEIRAEPYLDEWSALRASFQYRVFAIPPDTWDVLVRMIVAKNPDAARVFERYAGAVVPGRVSLEVEIEEQLWNHPELLSPFGYDVELRGRQVVCRGQGGVIDILCFDRRRRRYVVLELKNVRAGRNTFGQIASYMGWVAGHYPDSHGEVLGVVVARGADPKFESALHTTRSIEFIDVTDLGFE